MIFLEIPWNVSPIIAKFGSFELRWYGLLFASGFLVGYQIISHIFKNEGKPESDQDAILFAMILSTVIGARFGHYFFYEFQHFTENPVKFLTDMIMPPYQGLASHGAVIGMLTGLVIYSRKRKYQPFLWIADRVAITAAFGGFCIRMGNLMNHEIVGIETTKPWGFRFNDFRMTPDGELLMTPENIVRHPAQLYEALTCLVLFVILFFIWKKYKEKTPHGLITGIFFIWIFGLRFFYEFLKEPQEQFEKDMSLYMGQWLSIPAVLLGIGILYYALTKGKVTAEKLSLEEKEERLLKAKK